MPHRRNLPPAFLPTWCMARPLYIIVGVFFVALAFVGVFLPILPTTPFLVVAVWAFSRGSPRMERWLLRHPKLGPIVLDWRAHRMIPLRAKVLASLMMTASFLYLLLGSGVALRYALMAGSTMLLGAAFIWSKPHRAPPNAQPSNRIKEHSAALPTHHTQIPAAQPHSDSTNQESNRRCA